MRRRRPVYAVVDRRVLEVGPVVRSNLADCLISSFLVRRRNSIDGGGCGGCGGVRVHRVLRVAAADFISADSRSHQLAFPRR